MQETNCVTIIEQLVDDLKKIQAPDYNTNVGEILVGEYNWDDCQNKPSIVLFQDDEVIEDNLMGGKRLMQLHFFIVGYTNTDGSWDTMKNIYNLRIDIVNFLKSSDNTYTEDTVLINNISILPGGEQETAQMMRGEFVIRYIEA